MKKIFFYIICIIFVLIIILRGIMNFLSLNVVIRPGAIGNIKTYVSDNLVELKGDFVLESTMAYKSYNYRMHNNSIYITVYGTPVSSKYNSGMVNIMIKGDFSEIKNIYLEGKGENYLVWTQ